jgi:hypothetical protein
MGWAQGLQSGMALGNMINQGFDRRELADEAKKHQVEEFNPDQGKIDELIAQRDNTAKGLMANGMNSDEAYQTATQQYLPQIGETAQSVGLVKPQYSYGGQTFTDRQGAETAALQGRTSALASVYERQGNTEQANALRTQALQQRAAGLNIKKMEDEDAANARISALTEHIAANPEADPDAWFSKAQELKMRPDEIFKVVQAKTGIAEGMLKANMLQMEKVTANMNTDQLLAAHKDNDKIDPGSHYEKRANKDGTFTLDRVDTKTGDVISKGVFTGKDSDIGGWLRKAAVEPRTIAEYTLNVEKTRAGIEKDLAATDNYRADAAMRRAKANEDRKAKVMSDATVKTLNDLSTKISEADARGDHKTASQLYNQWSREYAIGATEMGKVVQPKQPGIARELTPEQDTRYKELVKSDKWERAGTVAEKATLLRNNGIPPESVGFAGRENLYKGDVEPTTPATPAPSSPAPALVRAPATDPGQAPVRGAGEDFSSFRNRTLAWDEQNKRFRAQQQSAASEQQRMQLLQGRPDLQRMGGGLR